MFDARMMSTVVARAVLVWAGISLSGAAVQAKAITCKGKDDCRTKITAAQKDKGGAVCFSTSWVPKPEQGWPEECRAEFVCGADKSIYGRAYFKPAGEAADWVNDPDKNTGERKYIGSAFSAGRVSFIDSTNKKQYDYSDWGLSRSGRGITSQGEAFMGNREPGEAYFEDKGDPHRASPRFFCDKAPDKGPMAFTWTVNAQKVIKTGRMAVYEERGRQIVEPEKETRFKVMAEGLLTMKKP